jgi:hypothetical protein
MWSEVDHMIGFEKEAALAAMHGHPQISSRLYYHDDFMAVARVINPDLCLGAFERRSCVRRLRYIGQEIVEGDTNGRKQHYTYGEIYNSVDFNGATYLIKETGRIIGMAYFEVVD